MIYIKITNKNTVIYIDVNHANNTDSIVVCYMYASDVY